MLGISRVMLTIHTTRRSDASATPNSKPGFSCEPAVSARCPELPFSVDRGRRTEAGVTPRMTSALFDPDKNCFAGAAEKAWARFAAHPGHEAGNLRSPHTDLAPALEKRHFLRLSELLPITPCCDSRHVVKMESRKLGKAKARPEEKLLPPDPSDPARFRAPTRSTPRLGRSVVGLRT